MSAFAYFLLGAVTVLSVWLFLSMRDRRPDFDREAYGTAKEISFQGSWDSFTSELSARIFDAEDSDFVASETPQRLAREFRRERTALALDWLGEIRGQVNLLVRAHFKAAGTNPNLKPADELRLGFEFLLFHLTSRIVYLVIWTCGPPRAAKLAGYPLELAAELRKMSEVMIPVDTPAGLELMIIKPEAKS